MAPHGSNISLLKDIALRANVSLTRLNVGAVFQRIGAILRLTSSVFSSISEAAASIFYAEALTLICEPGRAMVFECYQLLVRVKGKKWAIFYI